MPSFPKSRSRRAQALPASDSRFDRRLSEILAHATDVFCEKGYEGASMRDLSRASGMSLAGLYHYLGSKERLLYLIQKHTFSTIVSELKTRLDGLTDPAERIRVFIQNHLEYFVANQSGLKVLAHEDEALKNGFNSEIASIKREYYRICLGLMDDLKRERKLNFNSRTAVMSLFGMINWIYTWYSPRQDGTAADLAQQMSDIVLSGVCCAGGLARVRPLRPILKPLSSRAVRGRSRGRARDMQSANAITTRASTKALNGSAFRRVATDRV
jgi:TetR/AcrR family transcriptional regulator, cholesterol catabolism regulator